MIWSMRSWESEPRPILLHKRTDSKDRMDLNDKVRHERLRFDFAAGEAMDGDTEVYSISPISTVAWLGANHADTHSIVNPISAKCLYPL